MLNHYTISSTLTWITTLGLVIFVFFSGRRQNKLVKAFCFYMINISAWSFGWSRMAMSTDPISGLFWARALHIGAIIIPTAFLQFSLTLQSNMSTKGWKTTLQLGYILSGLFLLFCFSDLFVPQTVNVSGILFYPQLGPLYIPYVLFFALYSFLSFLTLARSYRKSSGLKQNQMKYVLLAYIIAWIGGCPAFFPVFGLAMWPYSLYGVPLCAFILAYTVLAHRLMDIWIILRRTGLIILVYVVLLAISAPIFFFLHQQMGDLVEPLNTLFIVAVLVLSAILSLGPFIYAYFIRQSSYFREDEIAGLAHELKSPLGAIQSAVEMLSQNKSQKLYLKDNSAYVDMINRNSQRLHKFIEELLVTFKSHKEPHIIFPTQTDLKKLIKEVTKNFADQIAAKNLNLSIKNTDKNILVLCDEKKIEKVLSNLISNAIKFSSENGHIVLSIKNNKDRVQVTVQDHGHGIPAGDLPYIFERFFQGKRKIKGTGIGLAVSKIWVEAHGGEISVKSDGEGKGTKVSFSIPK